jgi:hypothetical protein
MQRYGYPEPSTVVGFLGANFLTMANQKEPSLTS